MNRSHYMALVPSWLGDRLSINNIPIDVVTDFEKLATTVSLQDVCFYIALQEFKGLYVDKLFDDMESVVKAPQNQLWLSENAKTIAKQRELLVSTLPADRSRMLGQSAPRSYRKTNYIPVSAGSNCLAIVGNGSHEQYNHVSFVENCVKVLHEQLTIPQYQQFDVFKAFVQVAA